MWHAESISKRALKSIKYVRVLNIETNQLQSKLPGIGIWGTSHSSWIVMWVFWTFPWASIWWDWETTLAFHNLRLILVNESSDFPAYQSFGILHNSTRKENLEIQYANDWDTCASIGTKISRREMILIISISTSSKLQKNMTSVVQWVDSHLFLYGWSRTLM